MPGLLDRLTSEELLTDPRLAMAAGLLSPTPGGSFGGGLSQGLLGYQQQRGANQQNQLGALQQQAAKQKLAELERIAQARKANTGLTAEQIGLGALRSGDFQAANAAAAVGNAFGETPDDLLGLVGKVTPESLAVFQQSGNPADLVPIPKSALVQNFVGGANRITGEAGKTLGAGIGERANKRINQGFEAVNQNAKLDRVMLALARGADTGLGEEQLLDVKSIGRTLGLDVGNLEKMGEQEAVRAVSNEMALRMRNPESGLGLTGNTSNQDLRFLKGSVAGLNRTRAGNIKIIDLMKRFNQMAFDVANEQQRIIQEAGDKVPSDLDRRLMDFVNGYDIITDEERSEIESMIAGGKTPPSADAPIQDIVDFYAPE